jgi:predicted pyridoxine 5'-phosphate oxidase superfamily flavin-nucleotide-binding protein
MNCVIPEHVKKFFEKIPVIAFSTTDKKGMPNVIAIASKKLVDDNKIWIIDSFFDKTKENILQNNNVSLCMWEGLEGYQLKGLATYHNNDKIFDQAKIWIQNIKPNKSVKGVVNINVTEVYSISPFADLAGKKIV